MTLPFSDHWGSNVVGVDIGGTKTHVMVSPVEPGDPLADREFAVSSASWRGELGDFAADGAALRDLLVDRLGTAVLNAPLAVGAHGCENTGHCRQLEQELRRYFDGPLVVVNDSELMAPATGSTEAIGLVVGTGSIASVRNATGELVTAGGWGWLLGDEGSAPGIVREATRAFLAHVDRGGAIDALGSRLLASFNARDGDELALAVTQAADAQAWGAHAPEVFAAADEGSALADGVIRDAGGQLALLVDRLLDRGIRADTVVAGGSVIELQPRLQEALRTALALGQPQIALKVLDRYPVTGAVALARGIARGSVAHSTGSESPLT